MVPGPADCDTPFFVGRQPEGPPMSTAVVDAPEMMSKSEALRLTRVGPKTLEGWISSGLVRVRKLPGARAQLFAEDVRKLLEPATPPGPTAA